MWRTAATFFAALAWGVSWPVQVEAQRIWYVAPSGSDVDNECQDAGAPCATIAHALTRAATNSVHADDALYLAEGVYTESGLQADRDLNWIGAGAALTILQAAEEPALATDRVLTIAFGKAVRIAGVTIRHGRTPDGADDTLLGGAAGNGGGLLVNGTLDLIDSRVVSNFTGRGGAGATGGRGGDGGGIYCDGLLRMSNVVVAYNATGDGGFGTNTGGRAGRGWGVHNSGTIEIHHSTIHHNTGGDGGASDVDGGAAGDGAVWNSGLALLRSSTISDNAGGIGGAGDVGDDGASSVGGAWWNSDFGEALLVHATLADNEAGIARGVFNDGGSVSLDHVIVSHDSAGEIFLLAPVLMESIDDATLSGAVDELLTGEDPMLGELALLGGATPVRRLKPLSPAVNAGDPAITNGPDVDQRGASRIEGGRIDLGAYELQPATLFVGEGGTDGTNECRDAAAPCATLTHAVPQALPGVTIQIATGTIVDVAVTVDRPLVITGAGALYSIWEGAAEPGLASDRLVHVEEGVELILSDLTLRHGRAPDGVDGEDGGFGGAVYNDGDLQVIRSAFIGNRAGDGGPDGGAGGKGGAIYNNGALIVDESRFSSNAAGAGGSADGMGGSGGALYNDSQLQLRRTMLVYNEAGPAGGDGDGGSGGALFNAGLTELDASTLAYNRAGMAAGAGVGGSGGGLFNEDTLGGTNLTISGNETGPGGLGGGVANQGLLALSHSTIAGNSAGAPDGLGGGIASFGLELLLGHMLVSGNSADLGGPDIQGEVESAGYNLISDGSGLVLTGELAGLLLDTDGGLEPLADNGGPTWTHTLVNSSAAREAGDPLFAAPPDADQRGQPRRVGPRIDIGALEAPLADSDGDSLPDYWEILHGLDPFDPGLTNVASGASGDPDGDGVENWSEYIADTPPNNGAVFFRALSIATSGTVVRIEYPSRPDRLYTLQTAPPGATSAWVAVPGQIDLPGDGATNVVTHAVSPTSTLYRLEVRLP
ncbi:MAG TPA: choice-of-anchor Q domain-containing protein [Kiritimatiellia bacterium]|mgnify:CR=1 FL=1|nr:choice-of-anchor Q domain-containing protein [Kiritimatiellia bacterium]